MGEIPTKPGKPYRVTRDDIDQVWGLVGREDLDPTQDSSIARILQDFADRVFNASPWRPASEPPVIPKPFFGVEVLTKVPRSNWATKNVIQIFTREPGWEYSSTVAWMPIPPHGEPQEGDES